MPSTALEELESYVSRSEPWFRERLQTLVEHRTISPGATSKAEIEAGARAAVELMQDAGAQAELVACSGTPSVLARFTHPAPRTKLVVYNHLDVQPADPSKWTQRDPFGFEVHEHEERGFLYRGRGTTDDKGPALCALRAGMWAKEQGLPLELTLVWETEEEIGSPNFAEVVRARADVLKGDGVIVSDTIWPSDRQPAISTGLRGALQAILRLKTGRKDVHSGLVGGVARNPVKELASLVHAIEHAGFWQRGVRPVDRAEIESFTRSNFDVDYFKRAHDLQSLTTDAPIDMMLRLWTRPTFEVHGLVGGWQGPGVKSAVPPEAELKVSFRLVPDQDPRAVGDDLQRFVRLANPDVEVELVGTLDPYRGSTDTAIHRAIASAMQAATGVEPVLVREGGSIGAVPILAAELDVPIHFLPLSLPEHGYHAPNEYFDWRQARVGMESFARTFVALTSA